MQIITLEMHCVPNPVSKVQSEEIDKPELRCRSGYPSLSTLGSVLNATAKLKILGGQRRTHSLRAQQRVAIGWCHVSRSSTQQRELYGDDHSMRKL